MYRHEIARLRSGQIPRLQEFGIVPRKDISTFAKRTSDHDRLRGQPFFPNHFDAMKGSIHRGPHEIDEAGRSCITYKGILITGTRATGSIAVLTYSLEVASK